MTGDDFLCPFCRAPAPSSDEEIIEMNTKRMEMGDPRAMCSQGCHYSEGRYGLPRDSVKALELLHRAGELGYTDPYFNIGLCYMSGNGVGRDEKKAIHYWELAAIGGNVSARHNLGCSDGNAGNYDRALKHFMIAVGSGDKDSLTTIQQMYKNGHATKDKYAKALQAYQAYLDEVKSDDRDKAAAHREDNKYYE